MQLAPETLILMLSMHSEGWVRRALDAGARGYMLKKIDGGSLDQRSGG
jgi:DNA-binding NarL/FixJ family response regulator